MNERNPMDDLFRDKLYHYSMETPMHLWTALDARKTAQDKQTQRRRLAWYLTAAVMLLFSVSGALWVWAEQKGNQPPQVESLQQTQANTPTATINPVLEVPQSDPSKSEQQRIDGKLQAQDFSSDQTAVRLPKTAKLNPTRLSKNANTADKAVSTDNKAAQNLKVGPPEEMPGAPAQLQNPSETTAAQLPYPVSTENTEEALEEKNSALNLLDSRSSKVDYQSELGLDGTKPLYFPRKRGWRVYGEFLTAVDVPTRSLNAREPEFEAYRQAREQSEAVQNGFRTALRFSMISIDGISVRSGLSFSTHRETFSYQQQVQNNSFQTLDIPIVMGYERNNLGKFTLSGNAGVFLNMAFNQKGNFLSPDLNKVLDFSSRTPDAYPAFRNSLGLSFYGSIAASYPLTPRLRLVFEPYVLHHSGSFTANDYAIDQRYQNWGIQVGLRKKINKYIYFAKP